MARTYRSNPNTGRNDHRDQKVGWVYSPRTQERNDKRAERHRATIEARNEANEKD